MQDVVALRRASIAFGNSRVPTPIIRSNFTRDYTSLRSSRLRLQPPATTTMLTPRPLPSTSSLPWNRAMSRSAYGRTHVWKHRAFKLPKPFVPQFPQRVVLSDGSTFVHSTTSPRSIFKMTRDTRNNPIWNAFVATESEDMQGKATGRMGRYSRKFEGMEVSVDEVTGENEQ